MLIAASLLGLAACLAYALGASPHEPLAGDALVYHFVASAIVHGHGFSNGGLSTQGPFHPTAAHPPLFSIFLAGLDELGLTTFNTQRAALCALGTAGVVFVGLLGRRVAGPRAGLIAAGVAAVYPNLFMIDGMVLAESLYVPLIALILLLAFRLIERPSTGRSAALGAAIGLATLTRSEAILLVPLLLLPIAWRTRRERLRTFVVCGATALLVISPWLGRNWVVLHRFPLLSTNGALTSAAANCDYAYYREVGFFSGSCAINTPCIRLDEVREASCLEHVARVYVLHHLRRVPVVVLAREGRMWNLYAQKKDLLYASLGGRNFTVGQAGLAMYFVLLLFAVPGIISLRRRGVLVLPLLAPFVLVAIAAATTWGFSRYRVAAEIPLTVVAAVGIQGLFMKTQRTLVVRTLALAGLVAVALAIALVVTGGLITGGSSSPRRSALPPGSCRIASLHVTQPASCRPAGIISRPSKLMTGAIRLRDGRELPVVPGWLVSSVDQSQVVLGSPELDGWAADAKDDRPASAVLIFVGGRFLGAVKPTVSRPDVARAYGSKGLMRSGFQITLPTSVIHSGRLIGKLQLFAVEAGRASLLPLQCAKPPRQFGC